MSDNSGTDSELLQQRAMAILDYFRSISTDRSAIDQFALSVAQVFARRSIHPQRLLLRELETWAREGLPPPQLTELDAQLESRFGPEGRLTRGIEERLAGIVQRGRIRSAPEFRIVLERVESIHSNPNHCHEVDALNELLAKYQSKTKEPGANKRRV